MHQNLRWRIASGCVRAAISEPKAPYFLQETWRFGSGDSKSLAICDCDAWRAKICQSVCYGLLLPLHLHLSLSLTLLVLSLSLSLFLSLFFFPSLPVSPSISQLLSLSLCLRCCGLKSVCCTQAHCDFPCPILSQIACLGCREDPLPLCPPIP